jgi:hypothetical protein
MDEDHIEVDFQYKSFPVIPKECRQVDWTYVEAYKRPFADGETLFEQLKTKYRQVFEENPFAHLHFLRAIEDCMLSLSIEKRQPTSKCLHYLRRRLDLEYGRYEIDPKATKLFILARYANESGESQLARKLINEERSQLQEIIETCQHCLRLLDQFG